MRRKTIERIREEHKREYPEEEAEAETKSTPPSSSSTRTVRGLSEPGFQYLDIASLRSTTVLRGADNGNVSGGQGGVEGLEAPGLPIIGLIKLPIPSRHSASGFESLVRFGPESSLALRFGCAWDLPCHQVHR